MATVFSKKYFRDLLYFSMAMGCSASLFSTDYPVTSTTDTGDNTTPPSGTLRYALLNANANATSLPNSITFMVGGKFTIPGPLPPIRSNLTMMDLNGQTVTISGTASSSSGLFAWPASNFTLVDNTATGATLTVSTTSLGGSGGVGGAGGALGAGGGIFVGNNANVVLNNIAFGTCTAQGGAGGALGTAGGGGGMNQGTGGNEDSSFHGGGGGGFGAKGGDINGGGGGILFGGGTNQGGGGGDLSAGSPGTVNTGGIGGSGTPFPPGTPGGTGGTVAMNGGTGFENSGGGGCGLNGGTTGGNAGALLGGSGGGSSGAGGGGVGGGGSLGVAGSGGFSGGGGGASRGGTSLFGGGGGGGSISGGSGGFGGGSGSGDVVGTPGYGGGTGSLGSSGFGGGGAGMGGAIFVSKGATLNLVGSISLANTSTATGGAAGGAGATDGNALGQQIFLMSSGTINFAPDASSTFTVSSAIESDNGMGGGMTTTGGIIMSGAGVLDLTSNTGAVLPYTGSTAFNAGTTKVSADANLGLASNPISFDGGTLEITTTGFTTPRTTTLSSGGGVIQTDFGVTATFSSNIGGTGDLIKSGAGTLILTNADNYTGITSINSGTFALSGSGSIADSPIVSTMATGIFDISLTSGATINDLSGSGGTVALGSQTLTLGTADSTTYSGVIRDGGIGGGTGGSIQKNGSGTLKLTNVNTYTGGTGIGDGTLALSGSGSFANSFVNVAGVGEFDISQTTSGATIVDLGGGGGQVFLGSKTLTITSASGTLSASIQDGGIGGGIGGSLIIEGSGTWTLTSPNTYTGSTTITNATLVLLNAGAIADSSLVDIIGTGIFDISQINVSGTTIGALTGSGGTTVALGSKELTLGTSASSTYAGSIQDGGMGGSLIKQGSGTLTLSGISPYTGTTQITAGTLIVDGTIANSAFTVFAGATLGGNGTVGDVILNGTVSPGDSIGTLHTGNFPFNSGSDYLVELSNTASDLIASSGTVTINAGSTLTLAAGGVLSMPLSSYTIITSTMPIVKHGDFTLINPFPRFNFSVKYDPNDVMLILASMNNFTAKGNAAGVVKCFNGLLSNPNPDLEAIVSILSMQTLSQWQDSFNQMQPANFNDIAFAQENVAERIRQVYSRHFLEQKEIACPQQQHWRFWAAPFVEWVRQSGQGDLKGYKENFAGFTAALDWQVKHWVVTGGFSYAAADVNITHGHAKGDFNTYAGSLGAMWTGSGFFTDALFSYLYSTADAHRNMKFSASTPTFSDSAKRKASHSQHSNEYMGHLGGGYDFKINHTLRHKYNLYPFVGADYIYINQDGYTEHGAHSLDLKVQGKSYDLLRPEAGLGFGYAGCFERAKMLFDVSVSYAREFRFLGKKTKANFEESNSCYFTVTGLNPKNNLVCPTASIGVASAQNTISFTLTYYGEYGSHFIENAAEAEIKAAF